jgi:hypothetical protein
LPISLEEKIEVLVILSSDTDESTRNTAFYTLQTWNIEELIQIFSNPATPFPVLDFAANHLMRWRPEIRESLLTNVALPDDIREWISREGPPIDAPRTPTLTTAPTPVDLTTPTESGQAGDKDGQRETLLQRIGRMTAAEKISLALKGNQEERLVLIRDSNKVVARAVLQSPKVTEAEIDAFASMKNVTEEVLRLISMNRAFMKSYSVVRNLVNNPRAPIDVALPLLHRLHERDMKMLAGNKNVAEVLRGTAAKIIKAKQDASKPKLPGKH